MRMRTVTDDYGYSGIRRIMAEYSGFMRYITAYDGMKRQSADRKPNKNPTKNRQCAGHDGLRASIAAVFSLSVVNA